MLSTIILILICILRLSREYNGLRGKYLKAKIFHSLTTTILILITAYSIKNIQTLFVHSNLILERYGTNIGILTPLILTINFYFDLILSIIIFVITFLIIDRNEKARKILIYLLILLIPSSMISFYELQKPVGNFNDIYIFIIGFVIYTLFFGGIAILYKYKFMIEFFLSKKKNQQ